MGEKIARRPVVTGESEENIRRALQVSREIGDRIFDQFVLRSESLEESAVSAFIARLETEEFATALDAIATSFVRTNEVEGDEADIRPLIVAAGVRRNVEEFRVLSPAEKALKRKEIEGRHKYKRFEINDAETPANVLQAA